MRTNKMMKWAKPFAAALAIVVATSLFPATAQAKPANKNLRGMKGAMILQITNDKEEELANSISEIVATMADDAGFTSFRIDKYVSAYNVDTQDTFYIYPVYCNGALTYVAYADALGNVSVTTNTNVYSSIASLKNGNYVIYVDNGVYFASSAAETVELYDEHYVMTDEGVNFDGLSYNQKLDIATADQVSTFSEVSAATLNTTSLSTLATSETSVQGWWDWWFGGGSGGSSNTGKTVTKKCGITKFLLQGKYGLCWACTVGTIVDYKTGRNLEGRDVADMMGIGWDDGGTADDIKTALGKYGLSYKIQQSKLSFSQVQSSTNNDKPFAILLFTQNAGHAITGYGYSYNTANTSSSASTNLVYAWDSNGYQISFAQSASTVNTSGYRFQWYYTVY